MDNLGKYVYAEQKRQEGTGYMKQQTVYLKCDRSAEVQAQDVFLKDVAEIRCQDPVLQAKLKAIKIYHLVEWICVNRHKGWQQWIKAAFVCLISFFGTAYTIMAYHNDVGINEVFTEVYRMAMGAEPGGLNTLEVFYSLGLAAGIIVFFNHVGGRRLTKDPTPVEVSIKNYETDVDKTLIEQAGREGKELES